MLTSRYLGGIPEDSRAARDGSLSTNLLTDEALSHIRALNDIAQGRGQSLAQMALAWALRDPRVTSVLVGASSVQQLEDNLQAVAGLTFSADELVDHRTACGRFRDQPVEPVQRGVTDTPQRPCDRSMAAMGAVVQTGRGFGPSSSVWPVSVCGVGRCCTGLLVRLGAGCAEQFGFDVVEPGQQVGELLVAVDETGRDRPGPCRTAAGRGAPTARPGPRCRGWRRSRARDRRPHAAAVAAAPARSGWRRSARPVRRSPAGGGGSRAARTRRAADRRRRRRPRCPPSLRRAPAGFPTRPSRPAGRG